MSCKWANNKTLRTTYVNSRHSFMSSSRWGRLSHNIWSCLSHVTTCPNDNNPYTLTRHQAYIWVVCVCVCVLRACVRSCVRAVRQMQMGRKTTRGTAKHFSVNYRNLTFYCHKMGPGEIEGQNEQPSIPVRSRHIFTTETVVDTFLQLSWKNS